MTSLRACSGNRLPSQEIVIWREIADCSIVKPRSLKLNSETSVEVVVAVDEATVFVDDPVESTARSTVTLALQLTSTILILARAIAEGFVQILERNNDVQRTLGISSLLLVRIGTNSGIFRKNNKRRKCTLISGLWPQYEHTNRESRHCNCYLSCPSKADTKGLEV